jgi:hypothetical protein
MHFLQNLKRLNLKKIGFLKLSKLVVNYFKISRHFSNQILENSTLKNAIVS